MKKEQDSNPLDQKVQWVRPTTGAILALSSIGTLCALLLAYLLFR